MPTLINGGPDDVSDGDYTVLVDPILGDQGAQVIDLFKRKSEQLVSIAKNVFRESMDIFFDVVDKDSQQSFIFTLPKNMPENEISTIVGIISDLATEHGIDMEVEFGGIICTSRFSFNPAVKFKKISLLIKSVNGTTRRIFNQKFCQFFREKIYLEIELQNDAQKTELKVTVS